MSLSLHNLCLCGLARWELNLGDASKPWSSLCTTEQSYSLTLPLFGADQQPLASMGLHLSFGDVFSRLLGMASGPAPFATATCTAAAFLCSANMGMCGAGFIGCGGPSEEDLMDIENLDDLVKQWHNAAHLSDMQAESVRKEAASLGIGEPALNQCG